MSTDKLAKVEAILFVAGKPLSYKELATACQIGHTEIKPLLASLEKKYAESSSGLGIIETGKKVQLFSAAAQSDLVNNYLQEESKSDLTKPSLETLSIIAYRGPVSKEEIEQIRGINCSLIIRNLLMRGLVLETNQGGDKLYEVSHDFLRFMGLTKTADLPNYHQLSKHHSVEELLERQTSAQDLDKN